MIPPFIHKFMIVECVLISVPTEPPAEPNSNIEGLSKNLFIYSSHIAGLDPSL